MSRRNISPLGYYLVGTGSWFASHGIQNVMFAWLVTMVLHESPQMVGVAQMAMLVPAMLLMLVGGSLADTYGGRRVAVVAQSLAVIPPFALMFFLASDTLAFSTMIVYAVGMGVLQAFVTPARDGLLNSVAAGRIQRVVVKATFIQFTVQMFGFALAGSADRIGGEVVVLVQAVVIGIGAFALSRIPQPPRAERNPNTRVVRAIADSVVEGCKTVLRSATMRAVVLQNVAMGIFFMASYIVIIPLLIRESYAGSSADLAIVNGANSLGLVTMIVVLMRTGDIRRQGRALLVAQGLGAVFLSIGGLDISFWAFTVVVFAWGACGGVAMSMARTIMQELAPDDQRGRVMGFFSFSFMGAGPIGALVWGFGVAEFGTGVALITASMCMLAVVIAVALTSRLWGLTPGEIRTAPAPGTAEGETIADRPGQATAVDSS